MISASDRENAVLLINEAIASGASCKKACWTVWIVNFNTSHVTVYPGRIKQQHCNSSYFFQYISCYGLSRQVRQDARCMHISIHLMLRFIGRFDYAIVSGNKISIHLMLRFITRHHRR